MPEEIGLMWNPKVSLVPTGTKSNNKPNSSNSNVEKAIWRPETQLVDGLFVPPRDPRKFNKLLRKDLKDTTGRNWFDMPAPTVTPELKTELEILRLRSVIDPKRHLKKGSDKSNPKYFQVGTVIEGTGEFYSGRLTKKERKSTIADELLSDPSFKAYKKRKVKEIAETRRPHDVQKWKNKGRQTFKTAKQRRH